MPKLRLAVALISALVLLPTWACPDTKAESELKAYIARRTQLVKDGSLAKQISEGSYTADSLSLEMYQWWVQLGLANHAIAINNFVDMIKDAGMPQQQPPSKAWAPLVAQWALPILTIGMIVQPMILPCFLAIQVGVLSYQTTAFALADPEQGGSTDFLKAAQKWRSHLPSQHTSHLLMVHDFINELKSNDTKARLLPAYELVTQLINGTQSYRYLFNAYYAAYQQSIVPHNDFYVAALVHKDWPWSSPQVTTRVLWNPSPAGLDGCVIKGSVMQANDQCIDASTPVLGNFSIKALLINTVFIDHIGWKTWSAYEFSCANVGPDAQMGCIDKVGKHEDVNATNCSNWGRDMDMQTSVFEQLGAACSSIFNRKTEFAANNYVNISGKAEYYFLTKFADPGYFRDHTCKNMMFAANQSTVVV